MKWAAQYRIKEFRQGHIPHCRRVGETFSVPATCGGVGEGDFVTLPRKIHLFGKRVRQELDRLSVPTELAMFEVECDFSEMRAPDSQDRIKVVALIYPVVHNEGDL